MLNPPRPGSLAAMPTSPPPSAPPPASFSPLRGLSSWNTNTESLEVGNGVGCTSTVIVGRVPVQVLAGGTGMQAAGIGAPPMPWPQFGAEPPLTQEAVRLVVSNGFAASPGRTEM